MKHDYTALDSAIKEALATGPKKFRELENEQGIKKQGVKLGAAHNANVSVSWDELKPWHFLVRRLDALDHPPHAAHRVAASRRPHRSSSRFGITVDP